MESIAAGQEWVAAVEPSDVLLLASALIDAEQARVAGLVIGPSVDEKAFTQAARRAARRDLARLRTELRGAA